jgi:ketosteroid isomerase-like protein
MQPDIEAVRAVFQRFQDAYTARDVAGLDETMDLIALRDDVEMIGIGAHERNGFEWFMGREAIRDIIQGDWEYWGDVRFDVTGAKITVLGDTAWLSTTGRLTQTSAHVTAMPEYVKMMKEFLVKVETEGADADMAMMDATRYGLNRLWERSKGQGHTWSLVLTAILIRTDAGWKFHTLHWAMPVD